MTPTKLEVVEECLHLLGLKIFHFFENDCYNFHTTDKTLLLKTNKKLKINFCIKNYLI